MTPQLRKAAAEMAKPPAYNPPPERRAQNLRPKQRALLEAQLAAKAKKKAGAGAGAAGAGTGANGMPAGKDVKLMSEEKNYFAPKPKTGKERFGVQEPGKTTK